MICNQLSVSTIIFVKKKAMQAEAQKLELISWIASINDQGVLEKLYSVKKALEPKARRKKALGTDALVLLDQIATAYTASSEPDLNVAQIFTDRTKTDGRKLDFN